MLNTRRQLVSCVLIAGAAVLLFRGARDLVGSRAGQIRSAQDFAQLRNAKPLPAGSPLPGETIAKLTIPRLQMEIYVVEGDRDQDLRKGPGHLPGTAKPGANGNCVIAGHRDTHFRGLKDIRKGDDITVETRDGSFLYRVRSTSIAPPDDTTSLRATRHAALHLITCYPFYYLGYAPKRFIVEAQLAGVAGTRSPFRHPLCASYTWRTTTPFESG